MAEQSDHAAPSLPSSRSTNNNNDSLSATLKRLSLNTASATPLPPSSPVGPSPRATDHNYNASTVVADAPQQSPLRRTSSSSTIGSVGRSVTPSLHKKASLNSLHGTGGYTPPRSPALRRTSGGFVSSPHATMPSRSPLPTQTEESQSTPAITAATVARDFFQKELEVHSKEDASLDDHNPEVVVILHDSCYGHRFARPRTSKANLNTIVERPERIHATILGLATAYVRLGGRHVEGNCAPHSKAAVSSANSVPFRILKSSRSLPLSSPAVTNVHGTAWMSELQIMCESAEAKLALNGKELMRTAGPSKDEDSQKPNFHEGDLYLCSESLSALEGALGGVCEAIDIVFGETGQKRAFVSVRPPGHHCSASYPSGFCWLNNVHVGISHASITYGLTHAAIIDFDLHHGDGSQAIAWSHNARVNSMPKNTPLARKTAIGYFSLHDINSYPCEMGDEDKVRNASLCVENAHGQTIWNVHLQPWKTDSEFWELYQDRYSVLLTKARTFLRLHSDKLRLMPNHTKPKAAIFLSAGFDASEWESPGMQRHKVNVPTDFYARFTHDITSMAIETGLGVDGRVISVLEGGYSDRALMSGVLSHLCGLTSSTEVPIINGASSGLGQEMGKRLGRLSLNGDGANGPEELQDHSCVPYDSKWWALPRLEELENLINPPSMPLVTKKPRGPVAPTYTTPTQSFTAKVVTSPYTRRSFSAATNAQRSPSSANSRGPSPPPPEVDWATASHELCKLLIPTDRQTMSYRPEELNAEASRARRDRHSTAELPNDASNAEGKRMQLRDRKSRVPNYRLDDSDENKAVSRSNRRKTIAAVGIVDQRVSEQSSHPRPSGFGGSAAPGRRRLSVASTSGSINGDLPLSVSSSNPQPRESNALSSLPARRPSSSLSVRPGSSISSRLDPSATKKTKAVSSTRQDVSKPRGPKKQPAVPRVPSSYSKTSASKDIAASSRTTSAGGEVLAPGNKEAYGQNVEDIASGLKKMSIKLNVPPKTEQKVETAKKKPVAKAPRKSTVSRVSKKSEPFSQPLEPPNINTATINDHSAARSADTVPSPLPEAGNDVRSSAPPVSSEPVYSIGSPLTDPWHLPPSFMPPSLAAILAVAPEPSIPLPEPAMPSNTIEQQSESLGLQPAPLDPPSVSETTLSSPVATPKRTKKDLPIFTATSPIFFGKTNMGRSAVDHSRESEQLKIEGNGAVGIEHNPAAGEQTMISGARKEEHETEAGQPDTPHQRM